MPLPEVLTCPCHECGVEFSGPEAWDSMMDHVPHHMSQPGFEFGTVYMEYVVWFADARIIQLGEGGWALTEGIDDGRLRKAGSILRRVEEGDSVDDLDDEEDGELRGAA